MVKSGERLQGETWRTFWGPSKVPFLDKGGGYVAIYNMIC